MTHPNSPLTDRQAQCLAAIEEHVRENGMPPTYREIGAVMGITSTNGVHDHLAALHRKGYIELRHDGKARSIRLVRAAADTESVLNSDVLAADLLAEVERTLGVNLAGMSRVRMASAFRRILAGKVAA